MPSSDPHYSWSSDPSDSSDDTEETEFDYSGRIGSLVGLGEEDETSDSERTESFGHIPSDGYGHVMEADSGYGKAGDQDARSDAQKHDKDESIKSADKGKYAFYGHPEDLTVQEQLEVDYSGRIVSPVGEEDGTSDSERTESFGHIPNDAYGHIMEADSGYGKAGDQDARSDAQKRGKDKSMESADKGKSAFYGHMEDLTVQEQLEVDYSGWIVSPVGEEDGTSDSERTASFGHIPSDGYGHVMEADSGYRKAGDEDARSDAQKHDKVKSMKYADKGKSAFYGHPEDLRVQGKRGLLKILPPMANKLVRGTSDSNVVSNNTKMDGETGSNIVLTNTMTKTDGMIQTKRDYLKLLSGEDKKMVPRPRVKKQKEPLPIPKWLKDCKSEVADSDGWELVQVPRADGSTRKDKYYTHRDYCHTFRSKTGVQHFLKTGEVKGKGPLQKKSADPSGQSSGSRRSTKRRMVVPASYPIQSPQGFSCPPEEKWPQVQVIKLPHGFE